jgi:hypothetical protein
MLHTSKEKMMMYIGAKYCDDVAQEWTSKKCIVLEEPTYSLAIETRHTERVRATREHSIKKLPVSHLSRKRF